MVFSSPSLYSIHVWTVIGTQWNESSFLKYFFKSATSPAYAHILQDIYERGIRLSVNLSQLEADVHALLPRAALEAEADSLLTRLPDHWRQLQKVSAQDQLQPSKRAVVPPYRTCNLLQFLWGTGTMSQLRRRHLRKSWTVHKHQNPDEAFFSHMDGTGDVLQMGKTKDLFRMLIPIIRWNKRCKIYKLEIGFDNMN